MSGGVQLVVGAESLGSPGYRVFHYAMLLVLASAVVVIAVSIGLGVRYVFRPDHVHSKVYLSADRSQVVGGASTLTRTAGAAHYDFSTTGLPASHVMTLRAEIYNHPGKCKEHAKGMRCGEQDLSSPAVGGSTMILRTFVTRQGTADVIGTISAQPPEGIGSSGEGITNLGGAEIHFVLADTCPAAATGAGAGAASTCKDLMYAVHEP